MTHERSHVHSPRLAPRESAALSIALAAPAQAINLAPNGKGEVLIFPYYTVRNGFDTLLSVTNTSDRTVLANLRLREAKNGRRCASSTSIHVTVRRAGPER